MLNMSSPTTKSQPYISFKPGDIVNARGQIAVIVDVLHSSATDRTCLYVRFIHNIGNARAYDMLEVTPQNAKMLGVDQWQPANLEDLEDAISRRRASLEKEFAATLALATPALPLAAD